MDSEVHASLGGLSIVGGKINVLASLDTINDIASSAGVGSGLGGKLMVAITSKLGVMQLSLS